MDRFVPIKIRKTIDAHLDDSYLVLLSFTSTSDIFFEISNSYFGGNYYYKLSYGFPYYVDGKEDILFSKIIK